jgi:hypothetical protein
MASFNPKSETIQVNKASSAAFLPDGVKGVADKSKHLRIPLCS